MRLQIGGALIATIFLAACNQGTPSAQHASASSQPAASALTAKLATAAQEWTFSTKVDALTEKRVSTAMSGQAQDVDGHAVVVRCTDGSLETYFNFGQYLGNEDITVRYRLDTQPLVEAKWSPSADGTAVFSSEPTATARLLTTGKSLIIEAVDFRGQHYRATYNLTGAAQAIEKVLQACHRSSQPLDETVKGLRHDFAVKLGEWSPSRITYNKNLMVRIGTYSGPQNASMSPDFALAVQSLYDNYIKECKEHKVHDPSCMSLHIFWKNHVDPVMPPIDIVIYDEAKRQGKLPKNN